MKKLLTLTLGLLLTSIVAVAQVSKLDCAMVPNADILIRYSGKANDSAFFKQCQALAKQMEQEDWYKKQLENTDEDILLFLNSGRKFLKDIGIDASSLAFKRVIGGVAFNGLTEFTDTAAVMQKLDAIVGLELSQPINLAAIIPASTKFLKSCGADDDDLKKFAFSMGAVEGIPAFTVAIKDDDFPNGSLKLIVAFPTPSTIIGGLESSVVNAIKRINANAKPALDPFFAKVIPHDFHLAIRTLPAMKDLFQAQSADMPTLTKFVTSLGFAITMDCSDNAVLAIRAYLANPADANAVKTELWDQQFAPFVNMMAAGLKPEFNNNLPCVDTIKGVADKEQFSVSITFSVEDVKSFIAAMKEQALKPAPAPDDDDDDDDDDKAAADNANKAADNK